MCDMPVWAPKVRRDRIRSLYEKDATGTVDEELLDDVAYAIYARCQSILEVTDAVRGRARCPRCEGVILHASRLGEVLRCPACPWELPWESYKKSYKAKQLFGGGAIYAFEDYARSFPSARTSSQKMLLIDRLIHECHKFPTDAEDPQLYTRPAAINLIEGKLDDIIGLLEGLAYGAHTIPGALERLQEWRRRVGSAAREGYGKER